MVFDAEKCTNCMQCAAVCANDTFTHSIDFLSFLKTLAEKETILFTCQRGTDSNNQITIPCVGLFSEPLLAAMNYVAKGSCFIDIRHCPECANGHCLKRLHAKMQNLIHKNKRKALIRLKYLFNKQPGLPSDQKGERRAFLRLVRKTFADLGKESLKVQEASSRETQDTQGKDQMRTSAALQYALSLSTDEKIEERGVILSYFFTLNINEECNCCPLCTGMCPSGALKRKNEDDTKQLIFTSAKCSGCGLCVNFCRKNALTLKSGFSGDPISPMGLTGN